MAVYTMSKRSSLIPPMNVVKETVFINGEEFVFDSLTLTQELNDCQSFELIQKITSEKELWLKSPQKLTEMIGDSVLIRFEYGKEAYRYEFSGYITEVLIDSAWQGSRDNVIRFIGQGKVVVLEDTPSMYSFVDQHLVNIVKTIAQEKEFGIKCRPRFEGVLPFVMQYKESSFAFLNRLSALYNELFFYDGKNIVFGCPENETPEKLIFREDINQLKTISKALPYRYSLYNYSSQDDEYFFTQTDKPISPENAVTQTLLTQVPLFANRGILPAQEPVGYNADTQVFRQGKYQRALGKMHFIEGHSDTCKVRIGGLIQVGYPSEFGIDNSLGVYRVISVHHKVERGSYSNIFRAVPEGMEYAMFEPKTVAYPEIAEVVENNDPQGQGRVKVRFYWQRDKGAETNWIRVQSSDAGVLRDKSGNRGVVFIPEVGDQVMIGFEYGNPHQPFVMGSMFHKTNASEVSNNVRSITTKSGCKIVFDDNAKSVLVEDPSGNKFFMDGAGNIEVKAPKNMTFTVGEDFNLNVGNNMNATVGNNHTMSVTNDNMLLVQNNHTLEANNYGQTLQGNYNQSIQGKKLVAVTGNMEETSAAYYHTAQSGNVIIQSANISKLLGKKDALVNKTGFQKPRYFIEDVSDKKEEKQQEKQNDWLIETMDIQADRPQTGETDCVPTIARAAGKYLGMDIDVKEKQKEANKKGGVLGNRTALYFQRLGIKATPLWEEKDKDYYFEKGVPKYKEKEAIQFIVESLQKNHPVYLGFSDKEMADKGMGHAVLVTEIKYKSDFSKFKHIKYFDPQTGRSTGRLVSLENTYGYSEKVYNIISLSKFEKK